MKCPKCDAEIEENITKCPYCDIIIKDEHEEHKNNSNTTGTGCLIGVLILALIIFTPMIISPIIQQIEISNNEKHVASLIEQGKVKGHDEVINEVIELLKNRDENKLKAYLANDFKYYDDNSRESVYIHGFLNDLKLLTSSYEIEKRGNSIPDKETYVIYWDIVEANKDRGINRAEREYCLQKITIMLRKVVKENIITYEVEKIILTDN